MKNINRIIGIIVIVLIIIGIFTLIKFGSTFDKSNPIIYEMSKTEDYNYIIYQDKRYIPYSNINSNNRKDYLGYVGQNKEDEIYSYKNYSQDEWIILYSKGKSMLFKEQNITNIPKGLSSEYEWNN